MMFQINMFININCYVIKLQKRCSLDLNRFRLRKPITMHTSIWSGALKAHLETFNLNHVISNQRCQKCYVKLAINQTTLHQFAFLIKFCAYKKYYSNTPQDAYVRL